MKKMCLLLLLITNVLVTQSVAKIYKNVLEERDDILQKELNMMLGNDIILNDSEVEANNIIMRLKINELDYAFQYPRYFNYSKHFFEYKDDVKNTELFRIIQQMPKGAVLHAHDTAFLGPDYVLQLTYKDNLYVCFEGEDIRFLFSETLPKKWCATQWQVMRDVRYSSDNVQKFDDDLKKRFTLVVDNPNEEYTDINIVWSKFENCFKSTNALFDYKPVWEQYFYDALKALRADNIMYLEVRSVLPTLYDLKGTEYDTIETARSYKKVLDKFLEDYPDFYGAKLIYSPLRLVDNKTIQKYLNTALQLKKEFPDFFAGFDLVGQEDLGVPTKEFLGMLSEAADNLDYFFHAGETNWYGTTSDENLVDAIVLGTKRIGHAFAIIKHPLLIEEIRKRNIALEVNVVSNNVLKLVDDVRNHPLASLLARDLPLVVSSDDPGLWGAEPLSHDFYVTFLGVASRHADLRLLKKLALNSLNYSTYQNKSKMVHEFEIRWTKFINNVVKNKT